MLTRSMPRAGKLLCLDRKAFSEHLGDLQQLRHTWRFEALRRVPLLQQLSHAARGQLCSILEQVVLPKKTRVVNQGEPGDAFYIVETGVLAVVKDGKPIMRLSPGQVRACRWPGGWGPGWRADVLGGQQGGVGRLGTWIWQDCWVQVAVFDGSGRGMVGLPVVWCLGICSEITGLPVPSRLAWCSWGCCPMESE